MKLNCLALGTVLVLLSSQETFPQGCVPARFMSLGLGPRGIRYFEKGEWQAAVSYRYLYADEGYIGKEPFPAYPTVTGNEITIHSFDLQATYNFTPRFSATFTLPIIDAKNSNFGQHDRVNRHTVHVTGIGDVRLVGTAWLLDPAKHPEGNISIGIGFKAPTGDEAKTGTYYKPTGPEVRPVDISLQPGDGGWGLNLEMAGFQKLVLDRLYGYVNGFYLVNPREQNDAYTPDPVYGEVRFLSVPDQYQGRLGLSYAIWPEQGLALSFGGRVDGIPPHDAVGGDEGFRRPGYSVYVEPGISWERGKNSASLFTPVRVAANRQQNVYDERAGMQGGGAFAKWLLIARYARRF